MKYVKFIKCKFLREPYLDEALKRRKSSFFFKVTTILYKQNILLARIITTLYIYGKKKKKQFKTKSPFFGANASSAQNQ